MEPLKLIRINSSSQLVESWQFFLIVHGLYQCNFDGQFESYTQQTTISFQKAHGLKPDGVVGNKTFGVAMQIGFECEDVTVPYRRLWWAFYHPLAENDSDTLSG